MLTYFTNPNRYCKVFPCSELVSVSLFHGDKEMNYGSEKKKPLVMSGLPAVFDKESRRVFIGGREMGIVPDGHKIKYVRCNTTNKARPLGWMRDLHAPVGAPFSFGKSTMEGELKDAAENLWAWAHDGLDGQHSPPFGDKEMLPPDLVVRLRPGSVLRDGKTLHTEARRATKLRRWWPMLPEMKEYLTTFGLVAPCRGAAQPCGDGGVKFTAADSGKTTNYNGAEVMRALERFVAVTFGAIVSVPVWPAIKAPTNVAEGTTLFAPVPYDMDPDNMHQHSSWDAVKYCAAIAACREYEGLTLAPAQVVDSQDEPWVDLRNHPRFLKLSGAGAAQYKDEAVSIDLVDVPLSGLRYRYLHS